MEMRSSLLAVSMISGSETPAASSTGAQRVAHVIFGGVKFLLQLDAHQAAFQPADTAVLQRADCTNS